MRIKSTFLPTLLFLAAVLSYSSSYSPVRALGTPTVSVLPSPISCYIGMVFTVNVWASNLQSAVSAFQVKVTFNSSVLNCVGADVPSGNSAYIFYGYPTVHPNPYINNGLGYVMAGDTTLDGPAQTSGGLLAQLTFECVGSGYTYLLIDTTTNIFDPPISIQAVNGYFSSLPHEVTLAIAPQYNYYSVGENFSVEARVAYVERLSRRKLEVSFNSSVLKCLDATYPPGHMFQGHSFTSAPPWIDNTIGYVRHNASLLGQDTESGYGNLTQLTFQCVASGYSTLKIDVGTELKDPNGISIAFSPSDAYFHSTLVGDLTGPSGSPDGKVDIRDIAVVAQLFGHSIELGDPRDLYPDGKIDIRDIAIVAKNFGKHWP